MDDGNSNLRFGWKGQQRLRERERRERQREERRRRDEEAEEEAEMEQAVKRRLAEGDLRETVVARVIELLKTEAVQAQIATQADEAVQRKRAEELDAIEDDRREKVQAAKRKEEERLSEARLLKDILEENARKVHAETRRREEEEKRTRREREAELMRLDVERQRKLAI